MKFLPTRPLLAASCLLATACGLVLLPLLRAAEPTPAPKPAPATAPKPEAENDSADAEPAPTPDPAAIKEVAAITKADDLWAYIKKWSNLDDVQPDPNKDPDEQMEHVRPLIMAKIGHLQPALTAFLKQYPEDPRRWDAKLMRLFFLKEAEHIPDKETDAGLREIAAAKDASLDARQQARGVLLENALQEADPSKGLTPELENLLASYEKDFPDDESAAHFVALRLRFLGDAPSEKVIALLQALAKSPNKATAKEANAQLALRTEPLDLKFTAADGQEFDLAKLRGKVVLLDFWATWCAPCMAKLPEVLAVKKKYDAKDFQIVGVSLDEDKKELAKVTKQKGMDWPEACDEKSFKGAIPERFGIEAIPSAWLVDRKGVAHPLGLEADLAEEVAKLVEQK